MSEDKDLPIIRILSEEDEMHVKLELEMEEETKDMLVRWGKEDATDEDFVNIAIREGLLNTLKEREEKAEDEDTNN
jgi:hypothetical protein